MQLINHPCLSCLAETGDPVQVDADVAVLNIRSIKEADLVSNT